MYAQDCIPILKRSPSANLHNNENMLISRLKVALTPKYDFSQLFEFYDPKNKSRCQTKLCEILKSFDFPFTFFHSHKEIKRTVRFILKSRLKFSFF